MDQVTATRPLDEAMSHSEALKTVMLDAGGKMAVRCWSCSRERCSAEAGGT